MMSTIQPYEIFAFIIDEATKLTSDQNNQSLEHH